MNPSPAFSHPNAPADDPSKPILGRVGSPQPKAEAALLSRAAKARVLIKALGLDLAAAQNTLTGSDENPEATRSIENSTLDANLLGPLLAELIAEVDKRGKNPPAHIPVANPADRAAPTKTAETNPRSKRPAPTRVPQNSRRAPTSIALAREHPAITALVISGLATGTASGLLHNLPSKRAREVAIYFAQTGKTQPPNRQKALALIKASYQL